MADIITYYRTVSFLSVANMQVQLPDSCSSGPCAPSQLIATGCSLVYVPSTPVTSTWRRGLIHLLACLD
jgi:hypothetical protein